MNGPSQSLLYHIMPPLGITLTWVSCCPTDTSFSCSFPQCRGHPPLPGGPVFIEIVQTCLAGSPLPRSHIWLKLVSKVKNYSGEEQKGRNRCSCGCTPAGKQAGNAECGARVLGCWDAGCWGAGCICQCRGHQARGTRQQQPLMAWAENSSHLVLHPRLCSQIRWEKNCLSRSI